MDLLSKLFDIARRRQRKIVLPEGDEYEYLCVYCSFSVGTKMDKNAPQTDLLIKP